MKILTTVLLAFWALSVSGQDYPFAKHFVTGTILFKDSTQKTGQIKWFPDPKQSLKFKEREDGDVVQYSPEDIAGFRVDTLQFVSLFNFELYASDYAIVGKTLKVKHTFGQLLDSGTFNIYLVLVAGYNAISGDIQTYPNFLFEQKMNGSIQHAAYPFATRMKDKKYEKAKENLYVFFKDYPDLVAEIKGYKQQDDFFKIIDLMKKLN